MFAFSMLPAKDGDCLVISFGVPSRTVVIDIGRKSAFDALPGFLETAVGSREIDLLIVTHVDADHIGGVLKLTTDASLIGNVKAVWFNAHRHLRLAQRKLGIETFGGVQGERFTDAIENSSWLWNASFDDCIAALPQGHDHHTIDLLGGHFTLISPSLEKLSRLEPVWNREILRAGMTVPDVLDPVAVPGFEAFGATVPDVERLALMPEVRDDAPANGSSIAGIFEYAGRKVLCAGDAHSDLLEKAVQSLVGNDERLHLDLVKVSHHGSRNNTTRAFLEKIDCTRFAFSTDGSKHGHPDGETIARILKFCNPGQPKTLYFNYRSAEARKWENDGLMERYNYACVFADGADGVLTIDIE